MTRKFVFDRLNARMERVSVQLAQIKLVDESSSASKKFRISEAFCVVVFVMFTCSPGSNVSAFAPGSEIFQDKAVHDR